MEFSDSFKRSIARIPRRPRLLLGLGIQGLIPFASLFVALLLRLDLDPGRVNMSAFWIWGILFGISDILNIEGILGSM